MSNVIPAMGSQHVITQNHYQHENTSGPVGQPFNFSELTLSYS